MVKCSLVPVLLQRVNMVQPSLSIQDRSRFVQLQKHLRNILVSEFYFLLWDMETNRLRIWKLLLQNLNVMQ